MTFEKQERWKQRVVLVTEKKMAKRYKLQL